MSSEEHDGLPSEEEEFEPSEDEEDSEEERDVGRHRQKRKKGSEFIDDAADEDEEERPRAKKKAKGRVNQFIDDIAEVSEDDEDEDEDEEGMDDLIDDEGDQALNAAEMVDYRRQIREAEMQAAKDNEINPEELQRLVDERYGNRDYLPRGEEGLESSAVTQQALLPRASDPRLWVVRCAEGAERELVKCYDYAARRTPLMIKSAFCQDHLKGWAGAVADVDPSTSKATIKLVPRLDYAAIAARKPEDARANFGKQPKIRPQPRAFSHEEAKHFRLDVVPQRDRSTGETFYILNGSQRFLDGYLVKSVAVKSLAPEAEVPPLDEIQKFMAAAQVGARAEAEERAAAVPVEQGGDAGGTAAGGNAEVAENGDDAAAGSDLSALVQTLAAEGDAGAPQRRFEKGDKVLVVEGDLRNAQGVVDRVGEDGQVYVELQDGLGTVGHRPAELAKYFESGDHVKVVHGQHVGETGMVVRVDGAVCTLFTDGTKAEVRVFGRDLVPAVTASSTIDSLGQYELHDLVVLDANTVGVVVGVEADSCTVLTNQGRPDKADVRTCRLPDIKRKMNSRRNTATDGGQNVVGVGDLVDVVDGPIKGRSGTVKHVMRGGLFIQSRDTHEHGGFLHVQARHTRVRGGKRAAPGLPLMTPGRATPSYGGVLASPYSSGGLGGAGVLASPSRAGGPSAPGGYGRGGAAGQFSGRVTTQQDRLLEGREITIRKGPYRGMKGRVVSATATHVRMELQAQMKQVTVDRTHLPSEEGGLEGPPPPRPGAWGAAPTPMHAGGRTPMHPGIMATPAHYSSTATPLHPGLTPGREAVTKTPAYDAAWASTPAHPGFSGGPSSAPPPPAPYGAPGFVSAAAGGAAYGAPPPPAGAPSYMPSPGGAGWGGGGGPPPPPPQQQQVPPPPPPAAPPQRQGDHAHWLGVEVVLPSGEHAAVRSIAPDGTATVALGEDDGQGGRAFPPGGATRGGVPLADARLAPVEVQRQRCKVVSGDSAGRVGETAGADGNEVVLKTTEGQVLIVPKQSLARLVDGCWCNTGTQHGHARLLQADSECSNATQAAWAYAQAGCGAGAAGVGVGSVVGAGGGGTAARAAPVLTAYPEYGTGATSGSGGIAYMPAMTSATAGAGGAGAKALPAAVGALAAPAAPAAPGAAADTIGFQTGGAGDIENFRKNIDAGYLPLPTDIFFEGVSKDYYFDTTRRGQYCKSDAANSSTCDELFCPKYSLAVSSDPVLKEGDTNAASMPEVGLDSGMKAADFVRKQLNLGSPFDAYYYDQFGKQVNLTAAERNQAKIDVAKEVVQGMVKHLAPTDRVAVVLFETGACVPKALGLVSCVDMEKLQAGISKDVTALGSTNLQAGLDQATNQLKACKECMSGSKADVENRIVLITDAQPNTADYSTEGLAARLKANAADGIYTTIVGVGLDFNTELIDSISRVKGLNYYSIHSPGEFKQRLDDEFDYMVTPLVFDLELKIDPASTAGGWKILAVWGSPNDNDTALAGNGTLMRINTLFPSPKTDEGIKGGVVLVRMAPPKGAAANAAPLSLAVTYADRAGQSHSSVKSVDVSGATAAANAAGAAGYFESTGVEKAVMLARYVDLMRGWLLDQWALVDKSTKKGPIVIPLSTCTDFPSSYCPVIAQYGLQRTATGCVLAHWLVPTGCVLPPPPPVIWPLLGRWERQSQKLAVNSDAKASIKEFLPYFQSETTAVADPTLAQETAIMTKLVGV
eukprot:scaffold3.g6595.t1